MTNLLEVSDLSVFYGKVAAVKDVSFAVPEGPFGLGLIGESGSGKSSIARALVRLQRHVAGSVQFDGSDVLTMSRDQVRDYRRSVQLIFQDGDGSLDPRVRVGRSVAEALAVHRIVPKSEWLSRVRELFAEVGLTADLAERFPHELSGGQRQRVVIARALAVEPRLLILDEPTSALDVTVQSRILGLIERLREERQLSYILISHNLAVVDRLCDESVVLLRGEVVEAGPTEQIMSRPVHPYTRTLRAAVPMLRT